jgi:hypothetical protein
LRVAVSPVSGVSDSQVHAAHLEEYCMRLARLIPLAAALSMLTACSDSSGPDDDEFNETTTGTVASLDVDGYDFTAPRSGLLTVTLTWSGGNDLDLYLTDDSCLDPYDESCDYLDESDAFTGNSETVSYSVDEGDDLRVWVDNFDEGSVNYTLKVNIR